MEELPVEMAETVTDEQTTLSKLPGKIISSARFKLTVPNFFTMTEFDEERLDISSPSFEFDNATWQIQFQYRVFGERAGPKVFSAILMRLDSKVSRNVVIWRITLLDVNDGIYDENISSCIYGNRRDEVDFHWLEKEFSNVKPTFDTREVLTFNFDLISGDSLKTDEKHGPLRVRDLEKLSSDYKKLLLTDRKPNMILRVKEKEFQVHQDILMARSEVFEAMLSHDMVEKNKGIIDVPDCDPQAIEQFLFYIYNGEIETVTGENALGLYYAADKYNMALLKERCTDFIKESLSPTITLEVIQVALNFSDTDLMEYATEYFKKHTKEILPTEGWMAFMKSNPTVANELLIKAWNYEKS